MKRYLFFVQLAYAFPILRPLQKEIRKRGGEAAWYLEEGCPDLLSPDEKRLRTFEEVEAYNPLAVFAPGNYIYSFFPGIKVSVFHGYPINKRADKNDDHFAIRGWFDIYCTQGPSSTGPFRKLEERYRYFKVYETGWCKTDSFVQQMAEPKTPAKRPVIMYATTFTKGITSVYDMVPVIDRLAAEKPWDWIITIHPKLEDPALVAAYEDLARRHSNIDFRKYQNSPALLQKADVMLSDSSSIILEFMLFNKPVVTYRNTHPGPQLMDVTALEEIGGALEKALERPEDLMQNIKDFMDFHEAHKDGRNSARILDAVDDFVCNYQGRIKKKPLNLIRKIKTRYRLRYFKKIF